ncbi:MAG: hypothetical protein CMJ46_04960 [Planctomyces sp.]|nr:hypothetical protein [Planctomyces sp.]
MTEFSESLTVRIVGDSRHLDRELGNVVRRLTDFENRLQRVSGFRDLFGGMSRQISALSRPLQGVNQLLGQIGQQLVLLSQYPVTLNVTPALVSLQQVSQMIGLVMLKLQQMAAMASIAAGMAGSAGGGTAVSAGPVRQFASGGYVSGPAGVDRVPAMLTAGEYVLQRPVVQMLGRDRLDRMNAGGELARSHVNSSVENRSRTDIHHYGGFTFNVSQPVPMGEVLKSIRNDRLRLKMRRG